MGEKFISKVMNLSGKTSLFQLATGDLIGAATTFGIYLTALSDRFLLNKLLPKAQAVISLSQVYSVSAQQNQARIGNPMPVLYGKFRTWPDLISDPWTEFDANNNQYLNQLMAVTQGRALLEDLRIGGSSVDSFADVTYRLYQPGATVDLFHNNVATNPDVEDLELATIGVVAGPVQLTYAAAAHTITGPPGVFAALNKDDRIAVSGSLRNNIQLIVSTVNPDQSQILVTGVLVDESPTRPTTYATLTKGATVYGPARYDFSAALKKIAATNAGADGVNLSTMAPGDSFTITNSVLNNKTLTVATVDAGGGWITVVQALVDESAAAPPPVLSSITIISKDVGPFFANPAYTDISDFAVDIVFPQALYSSDDSGNLGASSATLDVHWRVEGSAGYTLAATETFTAAANAPQRYTRKYSIPPGTTGRIEVKVTRTSPTANSNRESNASHWTGLRGFLLPPAKLPANYDGPTIVTNEHYAYPDRTVLAVRVKATGQLSGSMSKQINGLFQRLLPVWTGTQWLEDQPTRSIAWAFADAVCNPQYGIGRDRSELDLITLAQLDAVWTARNEEFNGYIDQSGTAWDACKQILQAGRAEPDFDGRIFTAFRDAPRAMRTAVFSDQNVAPDSTKINFDPPGDETPRGVRLTYWDPVTYQQTQILCGEDINPVDLVLVGCTSLRQAKSQGNFIVQQLKYRRVNLEFKTEMDGFNVPRGSLITVQVKFVKWGQSARVLAADGLRLRLDQKLDWSGAGFTALVRDADGKPSESISCSRGDGDDILILTAAPSFKIRTETTQESTHITLGNASSKPMDFVVMKVVPIDEFHTTIDAVLDDPRVYIDPDALTYDGSWFFDGTYSYCGVK